jgi:catechol 2,3-dioxygenase-like lactoylglutathione lyase family enzyme
MLADKEVIATVAVKDLATARKFYAGTLGLEVKSTAGEEAITFKSGGSSLIVYRSQYAGTNKATALNWNVGDELETTVAALANKGVTFKHYDFPGAVRNGAIHVIGSTKTAWFEDPDGNIIALLSM